MGKYDWASKFMAQLIEGLGVKGLEVGGSGSCRLFLERKSMCTPPNQHGNPYRPPLKGL